MKAEVGVVMVVDVNIGKEAAIGHLDIKPICFLKYAICFPFVCYFKFNNRGWVIKREACHLNLCHHQMDLCITVLVLSAAV